MRLRASLTFQDKECCREPCSALGNFFTPMTGNLEMVDLFVGPTHSDRWKNHAVIARSFSALKYLLVTLDRTG